MVELLCWGSYGVLNCVQVLCLSVLRTLGYTVSMLTLYVGKLRHSEWKHPAHSFYKWLIPTTLFSTVQTLFLTAYFTKIFMKITLTIKKLVQWKINNNIKTSNGHCKDKNKWTSPIKFMALLILLHGAIDSTSYCYSFHFLIFMLTTMFLSGLFENSVEISVFLSWNHNLSMNIFLYNAKRGRWAFVLSLHQKHVGQNL